MAYTNAIFYVDLESGSDAARSALASCTASNPSGSITRINKTAHGLVTGAIVDLTLFTAWLNSAWKITVVDADNFDLDGAVWQATADASGTATPRGGSSKADAWLTTASGSTAARTQPGDEIRIKASADETLVGDCIWTQDSPTVTLPGAVTQSITDCETAWTASANITATADATFFREGTKSAKLVAAAGFTTGKMAYFATGSLNLSAYQQVSLWYLPNALPASTLSIRLCTDTTGDVSVHTIPLPAVPTSGSWVPHTLDLGGALNSAIQSVAIYADLDPGTATIYLDNIMACKASSSADSLNLHSLIGKVHNRPWVASTAYSLNDIRRPTQPNRNGFMYKVTTAGTTSGTEPTWPQFLGGTVADGSAVWTCLEAEDTWYPIRSIMGTTVVLSGAGYGGDSETVATYKREPYVTAMPTNSATGANTINESGTLQDLMIYTGGWNRTDMTTQTGETWTTMRSGNGRGFTMSTGIRNYEIRNMHFVRGNFGFYTANTVGVTRFINVSAHHNNFAGIGHNNTPLNMLIKGAAFSGNGANASSSALQVGNGNTILSRIRAEGNAGNGVGISGTNEATWVTADHLWLRSNDGYGAEFVTGGTIIIRTGKFQNNALGSLRDFYGTARLHNCLMADATELDSRTDFYDRGTYSNQHDQTTDSHKITFDGGTIQSATDQRHTASGISWKFLPTSTNRAAVYPLKLSIIKIACTSGVPVTVKVWTRRDSTDIKGKLYMPGGQIAGAAEASVDCAPSVDTWVQSSGLSFTPTENGVVEIQFHVWDGVGTTNSFWIDDISVT